MMFRNSGLIFLIFFSWIQSASSDLVATVDRTIVSDADLLTLTVRASNTTSNIEPDFSVLEKDFEIVSLSPQRNSSFSIVNGNAISISYIDYVIGLAPRRMGDLNIPPIQAGHHTTRPIRIRVQDMSLTERQMSQFVFFETTVDTKEVFVHDRITYTVKLFYAEAIGGDFPEAPELPDAVVETLGNEKRYESIIDGKQYYVLEKIYAIYPRRTGELIIPRERFNGSRVRGSIFAGKETVNAISKPHSIMVRTIPDAACKQSEVGEEFFFETTVDSNKVYVQQQIIYTVKLFYLSGVVGDFPEAPDIEGSVLERLVSEKRYESTINDSSYFVSEKVYAIFPQDTGEFLIPKERFRGRLQGSVFSKPVCIVSNSHSVSVKNIPDTFSGSRWIPARDLKLRDSWQKNKTLIVGKQEKREIEVLIEGFNRWVVPKLDDQTITDVSLNEFPSVENKLVNSKGLSTQTTTVIGIVPLKKGNILFPEINITWWNTVTDQEEVATIPAIKTAAYSEPFLAPSPRYIDYIKYGLR